MNGAGALHWLADKLDRTPSPAATLPPAPIHDISLSTQAKIDDALRGASSPIPHTLLKENTMSTQPTAVASIGGAEVTTNQPSPAAPHKSFLQKLGSDFKAVFAFLGSKQGQTIIATGEALTEIAAPGATGVINLANNWLAEIIKTESLAAAAGQQDGTGTQKAAMVISAVTPTVLEFAKANGLASPAGDKLAAANTALVAFLNAFTPAA